MFANLMRDTLSAYVTSGSDFTPVVDTVASLGKDVEQLESFGVVGGYDFGNDPKDMVKAFSKESRKRKEPLCLTQRQEELFTMMS